MKNIHQWLEEYGSSHRNPTNIIIHKICVPLIMFSVLGLLWYVPVPFWKLNGAWVAMAMALAFYARLSVPLALGMLVESSLMMALLALLAASPSVSLWVVSALIFVGAWIMQFVGHHLEGQRPSFFKDLQFLLIGPLWVLYPLYKKTGLKI